MSENERVTVRPIRPEVAAQEQRRQIRRPRLRLIIMAVGSVAIILLVCFLMFRDQLSPARLKRNFTYSRNSDAIVFSYDEGKNNAYTVFQGSLAAVTASGLCVYDEMGECLASVPCTYTAPIIMAGERVVLAADIGGNHVDVMDGNGLSVFSESFEGTILDADLSVGDAFCITELASDHETVVHVYDSGMNRIYQWHSASRYLNQTAISVSGTVFCAAALNENNGAFESSAVFFRTDAEEPVAEISLGNQMILELRFVSEEVICAIGEAFAVWLDVNGTIHGTYDYSGKYLRDYSFSGDGFVAFSFNQYQAGSQYSVVTLDQTGQVIAEREAKEEILSLDASGGYCGILTPSGFSVYDRQLGLCAETLDVGGTASAVILEDGSAILLGSSRGTLYLPN